MKNYKNDSTTALDVVCAVIFVLIIFIFFYSFQGDILGMTQYSWSDHQTHYDRLTGGIIFTIIACAISALVSSMFTLPIRARAMLHMPAMLLSGMVTGVTVDSAGNVKMSWYLIGITVLLLVLYPQIVRRIQKCDWLYNYERDGSTPITAWWCNFFFMIALTLMMFCMGNTDRSLHTRLAVERLCHEGKYDEALRYGIPEYDSDMSLTMWRAYALAKIQDGKKTELGEKLFNYNIQSWQSTLLPKTDREPHSLIKDNYLIWQVIGFVPRNINDNPDKYITRELHRGTARLAAKDYLLCTNLINRDLNRFVKGLVKYYSDEKALPRHYAEALLLYKNSRNATQIAGLDSLQVDNTTKADYFDFMNMMREKKPAKIKQADLKDNYFGTYWYYYYKH